MRLRIIDDSDRPEPKVTHVPDQSAIAQVFISDPNVVRCELIMQSGEVRAFERADG